METDDDQRDTEQACDDKSMTSIATTRQSSNNNRASHPFGTQHHGKSATSFIVLF